MNRLPGNDGLIAEYYPTSAEKSAPFLHQVTPESAEEGTLPPSLTQGLMTLIPKPKKDICHIDNWRLSSLLNNDHKIYASVIANHIKGGIGSSY